MQVAILILNYNGRELLAECLPPILRAARQSVHRCDVIVIDNSSTDASCEYLAATFPEVRQIHCSNQGLCSFNSVIGGNHGEFDYPVAVLLNNDIKLDAEAIDPLIAPFENDSRDSNRTPTFLTAPLCWQFDGVTCEGFKTAIRWRFGLVQATGRFPEHQRVLRLSGETACAGAALAVDCHKFLELGGFDPLYLPGRLEDLDLAFRAWQRGWKLRYEPAAVAYHKGQVSFGEAFGQRGCDDLARRNTLLFQWKNLRHPLHVARQAVGGMIRAARDVVFAPWQRKELRWSFVRAWRSARLVWRANKQHKASSSSGLKSPGSWRHRLARERSFFRRFRRSVLLAEGHGKAIEYSTRPDPALDAELGMTRKPGYKTSSPRLSRNRVDVDARGGRR